MRLPIVAAILAAVVAASCTSNRDPSSQLNLFAWSEYVPQAVIDGFTRDSGVTVNYERFASNEEMLAKVLSGAQHYDLIQPSEYVVEALVAAHRLMPIDWASVPNIANIGPEFLHLPHDPQQQYTVPWMAGSVGIVVNTATVREPIRGYADVFQPKYRGRIVVVNDPREIVTWGLATIGKGPNDITPASLDAVRPILQRWLPLVKVYDSDSPKTALLDGDVDLGVVWSGEAAFLYREDPKFAYVLPAEGAHQFVDTLAIPADARNPRAAMAFMNYILRPEVSRLISTAFPYTNPNLAARRLLSPEELANPASYPPGNPKLATFGDIGEAAVRIDRLVTELKAQS